MAAIELKCFFQIITQLQGQLRQFVEVRVCLITVVGHYSRDTAMS